MGQLLLRSLRDESLRTGVEESNVRDVFSHLCAICNLEGKSYFITHTFVFNLWYPYF